MSVLKRIRSLIQGRTEQVLDNGEDPGEQLAVFVNELNEQMHSLRRAVAGALADEDRLETDIDDHLLQAKEWESRAMLALEAGNEDLAKEALLKKDEHEERSLSLQKAWNGQQAATEKLKASLHATKARITDAKRKYGLLVAEQKTSETSPKVHESLSASGTQSPMELMEKLSDKIRKIEAEAEAAMAFGAGSGTHGLEDRFAEIERAKRGSAALEVLKAKLADKSAHP